MRKLLIFVLAMAAYGVWDNYHTEQPAAGLVAAHNDVIMYSLTTCGFCKQKGRELQAAGIGYREYFIDKDMERRNELNEKLEKAGLPPRSYGTPILDVHGTMLPNNPSLDRIRQSMRQKGAGRSLPSPPA